MRTRTLARPRLDGAGWVTPYGLAPFSPILYASGTGDGGQGGTGQQGGQQSNTGQQGGTGEQQQGNAGGTSQQQGGTGTGQDPAGEQQPQQPANGPRNGEDQSAYAARLENELAAARAEAGKNRVTAKQRAADEARTELTQQLLGILDPSKAGQQATPEQLTQQVTDLSGELKAARVELAAYRTAGREGANAERLLNSRAFADKLAALDPTDDQFAAQLKQAITEEVATDPGLYGTAQQGAQRSGAEFHGQQAERQPANLTDAIAAALGG
ncbi:hypothetical protein OOK39_21820 [Streptomyces sp. NBC_00264]|uniref:hypothetical protein n=1 Tax=unclassified Streptomyces TaxID=2593676 RepID=UPI0022510543|nr:MULTISPECIES: hypothetical protein [unclassified Streptomyces]MCX5161877.1 hypothetical protein [Streptomyces sp. NBC_00305]MCX5220400.1 hypothetical protein [Streptomyces sp. NBC_00264]